jgi:hypothetical protein
VIRTDHIGPNLTYRFVPDIWFEEPGEWADLGAAGLHMWFQEPWEHYTRFERDTS